jgi:acetylornithine deacetylase/succinyl-diaminopimelate desuccinylase-like protein
VSDAARRTGVTDAVQEALSAINDDEILDIEKRLVSIPSYTTEESEIAESIADLLNDEGIEVGLQAVSFDDIKGAGSRRSHNVIARIHGAGEGPSLMFNGHMDHGPIGGRAMDSFANWRRDPFVPVVEDGFLYGKGCQDEKGGICAMLAAAIAIKRSGVLLEGDLVIAPVCGHKTFSRGTHRLVDSGLRTDMAINTENSGNGIVPLHVGVFKAHVRVRGDHPHPAIRKRYPQLQGKPTPMQRVHQFLDALGAEARPYPENSWLRFRRHDVLEDFPWHHVEDIESSGYGMRVAHVWWRTPPGVSEATLREDLERLLASIESDDPSFSASVEVLSYGPALETPVGAPVVTALSKWHRVLGGEEPSVGPDGRYGGYGDASVLAHAGISSVAYGPGGGLTDLEYSAAAMSGEGPADERIPVKDLITAARVSTAAAIDLLG